jgi:hypothetical protein
MFRDLKMADEKEKLDRATDAALERQAEERAAHAGMVVGVGGVTREQALIQGSKLLAADDSLKRFKDQAELNEKLATIDEKNYKRGKEEAQDGISTSVMGIVHLQMDPIIAQFNALVSGASEGIDPVEWEKSAPNIQAAFNMALQNATAIAVAHHATPETVAAITAQINTMQQGFKDIYSGPSSMLAGKQRALATLNADFGLSNAKAFPALVNSPIYSMELTMF